MNKEETFYNIKKLITEYSKRKQECSRQWDILNESENIDSNNNAISWENKNFLIDEMQIYENFINELKSLMKD